jgi:hypothetical protein
VCAPPLADASALSVLLSTAAGMYARRCTTTSCMRVFYVPADRPPAPPPPHPPQTQLEGGPRSSASDRTWAQTSTPCRWSRCCPSATAFLALSGCSSATLLLHSERQLGGPPWKARPRRASLRRTPTRKAPAPRRAPLRRAPPPSRAPAAQGTTSYMQSATVGELSTTVQVAIHRFSLV